MTYSLYVQTLIAVFLLIFSVDVSSVCNITDTASNSFYDLGVLARDPKIGHIFSDGEGHRFRINICQHLNPISGENFMDDGHVNCYQSRIYPNGTFGPGYICGHTGLRLIVKNNNDTLSKSQIESYLQLNYGKGDYCDPDDKLVPRQLIVTLICDREKWNKKDPNDLGRPVYLSDSRCTYQAIWKTWAACPIPITTSIARKGWSFSSLLYWSLILLLTYFALAILYKTFILKESGWNRIPHIKFFRKIYGKIVRRKYPRDLGYAPILSDNVSSPDLGSGHNRRLIDRLDDIEA